MLLIGPTAVLLALNRLNYADSLANSIPSHARITAQTKAVSHSGFLGISLTFVIQLLEARLGSRTTGFQTVA